MANTLIKDFPSTAASPAADDFLPLDGATNGTRKWASSHFQNLGTGDSPTFTAVSDTSGNLRNFPQNSQGGTYTLVVGDVGKHIYTSSGVTVPSGVFSAGQAVSIVNSGTSNITITQGASVTMYNSGTSSTGNRTLAQKGIATALCIASNTFIIAGAGLS